MQVSVDASLWLWCSVSAVEWAATSVPLPSASVVEGSSASLELLTGAESAVSLEWSTSTPPVSAVVLAWLMPPVSAVGLVWSMPLSAEVYHVES